MSCKVLHISTVHHPLDPRISFKQLPALASAGYEVHFMAQGKIASHPSAQFHALKNTSGQIKRLFLQIQAYQIFKKIKPQIVQIHDPELLPFLVFIKKRFNVKIIYDMHEDYARKGGLRGKMIRKIENWAFKFIDHTFIAESDYVYAVQNVPHTLIPNYSLPKKGQLRNISSPIHLIFTGVISKTRGLFHLWNVAQTIYKDKQAIQVSIWGKCNISADLTRLKALQSTAPNVPFEVNIEQYTPTSILDKVLEDAHFGFILFDTHPTENGLLGTLPTKFYEYLSAGLPIICSNFPRWQHFVESNAIGFAVAPDDAPAILAKLAYYKKHPEAYQKLSANALSLSPQYQWQTVVPYFISVYEELKPK